MERQARHWTRYGRRVGPQLAVWIALGGSAGRAQAVLEWRYHAVSAPQASGDSLHRPTQVLIGPAGTIYVVDDGRPGIGVLDSVGRFIHWIGRGGQGPGEFRSIAHIGWIGDTLWVSDATLRRVSLFTAAGEFVRILAHPAVPPRGLGTLFLARALLANRSFVISETAVAHGVQFARQHGLLLLRAESSLARVDTLGLLPFDDDALVIRDPNGMFFGLQPWADIPLVAIAPDSRTIVIVERPIAQGPANAEFTVTAVDAAGVRLYATRVPYRPVPLTDQMVDAWVASYLTDRLVRAFPTRSAANLAVRAGLFRPAFLPPVREAVMDQDGRIWLKGASVENTAHWVVLDRSGRSVSQVHLDERLRGLAVSPGTIWALREHDDGSQSLVRYQRLP